jgi:2'-5' RNA ligase
MNWAISLLCGNDLLKFTVVYNYMKKGGNRMYGVIANLDPESQSKIYQWREALKMYGIPDYDGQPHVTIATHEELDLKRFIEEMNEYFSAESTVPVFFPSLGMFLKSGVLFLAPVKDQVLTGFHERYHEHFQKYRHHSSLYTPNRWVPHCTVASHLSHKNLTKAFEKCSEWIGPFYANLVSVSLLEVHFDDNGYADVQILHTADLLKR